jgi:hypothetical protein
VCGLGGLSQCIAHIIKWIDIEISRIYTSHGRVAPNGSRRRECGGAADVVQIAPGAGYHTAVMKWNVFIGNICGGCWQQL